MKISPPAHTAADRICMTRETQRTKSIVVGSEYTSFSRAMQCEISVSEACPP